MSKLKIAIHQPNLAPWLPFFYKMAMADVFVMLCHSQYRKGGFENRFMSSDGKWTTKPIEGGIDLLINKKYSDGTGVIEFNLAWILLMKETLGIDTKIELDYPTELTGTDRLIDIVKHFGGGIYITNPTAKDKYLNEDQMIDAGVDIEYCKIPPHLNIHTFEAWQRFGIDGTKAQMPKREVLCEI